MASRGLRDMDGGQEPIPAPEERAQVKRQARRVHLRAFVIAALLTMVTLLLPA